MANPQPIIDSQPSTNNPQPLQSDSGQKQSDSIHPQPLTNPQLSTNKSQPLTAPQPLWSLQPNEPVADYQLFAAWLQLPAPRTFTKTAATLGCSLRRLRRLSARHNWKTRAAAFDNYRANAASLALDQLLRDETLNWKERVQRFRLQEWLLHEQMLQAASEALHAIQKRPSLVSLHDLAKIMELASTLGRRACGMPLEPPAASEFETPRSRPEVEAALNKIYGQDNYC